MPDLGERVPEDVGGVSPSLRHVNFICTIGVVEGHLIKVILLMVKIFSDSYLHKLWNIESK